MVGDAADGPVAVVAPVDGVGAACQRNGWRGSLRPSAHEHVEPRVVEPLLLQMREHERDEAVAGGLACNLLLLTLIRRRPRGMDLTPIL